jgi:hypothetical protein
MELTMRRAASLALATACLGGCNAVAGIDALSVEPTPTDATLPNLEETSADGAPLADAPSTDTPLADAPVDDARTDGIGETPPDRPQRRCRDLLALGLGSGRYRLDPDGDGPESPFDAYCDQQTRGGGWTLVLKIDGASATFAYDNPLWSNALTLNDDEANLAPSEHKSRAFSTVPFEAILLSFDVDGSGMQRTLVVPVKADSLLSVLKDGQRTTSIGRDEWTRVVPGHALQPLCNAEGINLATEYVRARIGIVGNNENDCASCDSAIGIGIRTPNTCAARATAGYAGCQPGGGTVPAKVRVFVR